MPKIKVVGQYTVYDIKGFAIITESRILFVSLRYLCLAIRELQLFSNSLETDQLFRQLKYLH